MSKYVQFEFVFDKNRIGFDISWYRDLNCLQIAIPFIVITFNFSGEWRGDWKDSLIKVSDYQKDTNKLAVS